MNEITAQLKDGGIKFAHKLDADIWQEFKVKNNGKKIRIIVDDSKRTYSQNNALHKFFELLAETLNGAGLDMKTVIKPEVDIEWTTDSVKNYIWRPIQMAVLGVKSTTKLKKHADIDKVYDHLNRHLSEKFGSLIEIPPFPSQRSGEAKIEYPERDPIPPSF